MVHVSFVLPKFSIEYLPLKKSVLRDMHKQAEESKKWRTV
jgi:hypothetical protein